MHHLKETVIDGVKFVLIPETLHDTLARMIRSMADFEYDPQAKAVKKQWLEFDSEIFNGI